MEAGILSFSHFSLCIIFFNRLSQLKSFLTFKICFFHFFPHRSISLTEEKREELMGNPLQLKSLNHISLVCRSVENSIDFYEHVLGFFPIKRPSSFDFNGAWLFNYGIGIHLLQSDDPESMPKIGHINPKDNHISFQSESITAVENKLKQLKIEYVKRKVEESGIYIDQLFFHDPDGTMIEICNCYIIPVVPLSEENVWPCSLFKCNIQKQQQQIQQIAPMHQQEPITQLPSIPMNSFVQ